MASSNHFSTAPRNYDSLITTSIAALTSLTLIMPRVGPLIAAAVAAIACAVLIHQASQRSVPQTLEWHPWRRPEGPFLIWVFVACLWASNPGAALAKAAYLALLFLIVVVFSKHLFLLNERQLRAISLGIPIGVIVGGTYLAIEILTQDAIARATLTYFPLLDEGLEKRARLQNGVVTRIFSPAHDSRVAAVFCLLWCPAMLAALLATKGLIRALCFAAIATASLIVLVHPRSPSQTAELAMVLMIGALLVAAVSTVAARRALGALLAVALFLIVPASLAMHAANLHTDEDLFRSARARVIIWNYTAERVLEHPLLGVGTNSTRYIDEARPKKEKLTPKTLPAAPATRAHPHNVYLQIWYEFGLIGVLAFAFLGFSLLRSTALLPRLSEKFALGHFGACMVVIAPSYGMWQSWFQSATFLSVLALLIVSKVEDPDPPET